MTRGQFLPPRGDGPEYQERDVNGEATITSTAPPTLSPHPPGEFPTVPPGAVAIHRGSRATLDRAYAPLTARIATIGYSVAGPTGEYDHRAGNDPHNPAFLTGLRFPLAKPCLPLPAPPAPKRKPPSHSWEGGLG